MASYERTLTPAPCGERERELWLQHAAGLILWEDVRNYAINQLNADLSDEARAAALKGIDHAVYGLMMVLDGVSGSLANYQQRVTLDVAVRLTDVESNEQISRVHLADGDGMCMGYHGWLEGDFGEYPPAE